MKFSKILSVFLLALVTNIVVASGTLQFYILGLAFHPQADALKSGAHFKRKMDEYGMFVWTPGLAVGYDFRDKLSGSSWSLSTFAGGLRECCDLPVYIVGVGPRYRYYFTPKFSGDFDIHLTFVHRTYPENKVVVGVIPAPSIGLNYHFDNLTIGIKATFGPAARESDNFSTLLSWAYVSYSF